MRTRMPDEKQPATHRDGANAMALSPDDVLLWRRQLVRSVLRSLVVVGPLVAVAGSYYDFSRGQVWTIPLYWSAYVVVLLCAFWRRVPYAIQAGSLIVLVYALGALDFPSDGLAGSGRIFLLLMPFMAGALLGLWYSIAALVLAMVTMLAYGLAFSYGLLTIDEAIVSTDLMGWITSSLVVGMVGVFVVVTQAYFLPRLVGALQQAHRLAQELQVEHAKLEEQVANRTDALARRTDQLTAAAEIARDAAALQDVHELVDEATRLITNRLGFYHAGIFMVDEVGKYAVLQAASSPGGQRMLARRHRLRIGEEGIVGYVTGHGEPRIALDVARDELFLHNEDLSQTRSEIALPLRARGNTIGALDIQSTEPEAFSTEDISVLQALADQIAIAIRNIQLVQEVQSALQAERRAYGTYGQKAWQSLIRGNQQRGQRYDPLGLVATTGNWHERAQEALADKIVQGRHDQSPTLAIPLKVRDQVIGVIDAYKPQDTGDWTPDEIELAQILGNQLGVALESARLYEDTQRRAAHDRILADVTGRMRETLEMDRVLQTAIREIGEALNVQVKVRMGEQQAVALPPNTKSRGKDPAP